MDTSLPDTHDDTKVPDTQTGAPTAQVKPLSGHLYEVRLPDETAPHIVSRSLAKDSSADSSSAADAEPSRDTHLLITNYCTCEDERMSEAILEAATPDLLTALDCPHRRAVEAFIEAGRQVAAQRRQSELTYTGMRVAVAVAPEDTGPTPATEPRQTNEPTQAQVEVWEGERVQPLDPVPSQQLFKHSSTGFEWGYSGSGPAQLALAILLDFTGDPEVALLWHQEFKEQFIASLPRETLHAWEIDGTEIESFLRQRGWQPPTYDSPQEPEDPWFPWGQEGEELEFSGYYGSTGQCRVYFRRYQGQSIVLVSDLPNSGGTSVTNRIEVVAAMVCLRFRIAPERLVLIQYHPPSSISGESFKLLSFRHRNELLYPQWTNLRRRDATFLWGRTLPF